MRRSLLGLVVVLVMSAASNEARAQVPFGNVNDPFFAYYSFYLPRQQAQAMAPGPEATINAATANRQQYAATNRNGMFDPNSSSFGSLDFGDDFSSGGSGGGGARKSVRSVSRGPYGVHGGNLNGLGPQGYYGTKVNSYYPNLRTGRGKNNNVSVVRSRGYSGGGGGYGGLGGGLPGPR